jgi:hypothetical protein
MRHAKLPGIGWRRGQAVFGKTSKLVPDYMYVGKKRVHAPEGRYVLRFYDGKLPRYQDVGNNPTDALEQLKKARRNLELKNAAAPERG